MRQLLLRPDWGSLLVTVLCRILPPNSILAYLTLNLDTRTDTIPVWGSALISFASRCARSFTRAAECICESCELFTPKMEAISCIVSCST